MAGDSLWLRCPTLLQMGPGIRAVAAVGEGVRGCDSTKPARGAAPHSQPLELQLWSRFARKSTGGVLPVSFSPPLGYTCKAWPHPWL